jgi:hypothetical protein
MQGLQAQRSLDHLLGGGGPTASPSVSRFPGPTERSVQEQAYLDAESPPVQIATDTT